MPSSRLVLCMMKVGQLANEAEVDGQRVNATNADWGSIQPRELVIMTRDVPDD